MAVLFFFVGATGKLGGGKVLPWAVPSLLDNNDMWGKKKTGLTARRIEYVDRDHKRHVCSVTTKQKWSVCHVGTKLSHSWSVENTRVIIDLFLLVDLMVLSYVRSLPMHC